MGFSAGEQHDDACFMEQRGVVEASAKPIETARKVIQGIDHDRHAGLGELLPHDPGFLASTDQHVEFVLAPKSEGLSNIAGSIGAKHKQTVPASRSKSRLATGADKGEILIGGGEFCKRLLQQHPVGRSASTQAVAAVSIDVDEKCGETLKAVKTAVESHQGSLT